MAMAMEQLSYFFVVLFIFHTSEFLLALLIHGCQQVSCSSFLFSKEYLAAMTCGMLEYAFESYFVPDSKCHVWISYVGLIMVILGEFIRKLAILTAWNGFTHHVKTYHREGHTLVTHGIYRLFRHPGYAGFFVWSVGTQVMLCNPVCSVGYAVLTWRFFRSRISYEEHFLKLFFGEEYETYAEQVPSGIPFVR